MCERLGPSRRQGAVTPIWGVNPTPVDVMVAPEEGGDCVFKVDADEDTTADMFRQDYGNANSQTPFGVNLYCCLMGLVFTKEKF